MLRRLLPPLVLALVLLAPLAAAEFGPESEDGYPINVDGEVIRPPVAPVILTADDAGNPLNKAGPFTAYPYWPLLTAEVMRLADEHPDKVKLTSAGKSTIGLDLWLLEIANFAAIEAGEGIPLEDREVLYIDGGTHSNEYSGVYFVTELAQFLLDEYASNETAKWIVDNRHVFILPMVNPDGSNAFGRLNAKTVNINRNFPGTWGTVNEQPLLNNPGPAPGSEVETQIVMSVIEKVRPDYVNSIHCCGNLWLHPYGAEQLDDPADLAMFTRICDEVFYDVRDACGEIWSTIYPASGTTADQGYEQVGASSWTYEMSGRGAIAPWGQPVINEDVRVQERESWRGVLHALQNVEKYGARPEVVAVAGDASRLEVTITNVGYGPLVVGNLTLGGATVALPPLAPGETGTVSVDGSFAAGPESITLDWQKRARHSPTGLRAIPFTLAASGGGLVGEGLPGEDASVTPAGDAKGRGVSAPALALAVLGVAAAAMLRRKA